MAKNLNQIATAAASLLSTDKMYIARSPFGVTDDRYILGSSLISQFGTVPLTTKGDLYTFSTVDARLAVGTLDGQILQVNSAAAVGLAWSTATYPVTTTVNQLLYSSSANVVAGLATANNGVLVTDAGGIPSIGSTLPAAVQGNITALGTIVTGVWNGTPVTVTYGGTGASSFTAYMPVCGGTTSTGILQSVSTAGAVAGYALTYVSNAALPTWQAVGAPFTPAALTKADDTNVTLTLGGTPATALLQATSITAGWTGQLSLARGGTNASLVASAGGIFYSTGSAGAILSGTATAQQMLQSGSSAAPSWSTSTWPATTTANQILYSSATNVVGQITSAASSVLITSAGSVPSLSQTLPSAVQANITVVGTIVTGIWNGTNIDLAHGGTNASLTGSLGGIVYSTATAFAILAGTATAGQMLQSGSTAAPTWSTAAWPATTTAGRLLYSSTNNNVTELTTTARAVLGSSSGSVPNWLALTDGQIVIGSTAGAPAAASLSAGTGITITPGSNSISIAASSGSGSPLTTKGDIYVYSTTNTRLPVGTTDGQILQVSSGAATGLAYSTPTYPSASGSAGQIIRSDGTNNVYTTSTYPNTNAVSTLLYASSANVMAALATANNGTLVTDGSGVPSISSTLPSAVVANIAGRLLAVTVYTSGTNTFTPNSATATCIVYLVGGGGAGGSVAGGGGGTCGGGGGASGGVAVAKLTKAQMIGAGTTSQVVIGTGGTAGATGNHPGGNGVDSTLKDNGGAGSTLITAGGGGGGAGGAVSVTSQVIAGGTGAGVTIGTGTSLVAGGDTGGNALSLGAVAIGQTGSGGGAPGFSGKNGPYTTSGATGTNAGSVGQGGSGGFSSSASNVAGGTGAAGICIIYEYS